MVKAGDQNLVMVLTDLNVYGITDVQSARRSCPIGKDKLEMPLRALLKARQGSDSPNTLENNIIYICFNAGKDRLRQFKKVFSSADSTRSKKYDKSRLFCHKVMLHSHEQSWIERTRHLRGRAKLSQYI